MIFQIATRCGIPPSKIEKTWSIEELQTAEVLAVLEGWGQEKRRTATIIAEFHNAIRLAVWARNGDRSSQAPKPLTASHFLPRRVKLTPVEKRVAKNNERLYSTLNALCGY